MITTGDINKSYDILGIVGTHVSNQDEVTNKGGCGGNTNSTVSVTTNEMYSKGAEDLVSLAKGKGGNAVVYASFEYRIAISGTGNLSKQVKELFCYGTAIKFTD
jgi:uncharacterized protein YbjQ (UPF0145 family)